MVVEFMVVAMVVAMVVEFMESSSLEVVATVVVAPRARFPRCSASGVQMIPAQTLTMTDMVTAGPKTPSS